MRQSTLIIALILTLGTSLPGWAIPVPFSALGLDKPVVVSTTAPPQYPVNVPGVGRAGGFSGSVDGFATTLWCVDSQLFLNSGTNSYDANVILLSSVAANPTRVQYGDVSGTTSAPRGFINDLGAGFNTAQARFSLAAFLVSQYTNFPSGPSADDARNKAIQKAIWQVMLNETKSFDSDVQNGNISTGAPGGGTWIQAAQSFVSNAANASFFTTWAVVSGGLDSSGNLLPVTDSGAKQTYLVQVVPEPSFYPLIALGLGALLFARRRSSAGFGRK